MRYITSIERLGREEGLEEGLEKGREEKSLEVARRLLSMGLSREQIQQATDLSEQQIIDLEKE